MNLACFGKQQELRKVEVRLIKRKVEQPMLFSKMLLRDGCGSDVYQEAINVASADSNSAIVTKLFRTLTACSVSQLRHGLCYLTHVTALLKDGNTLRRQRRTSH